MAKDDLHRRAVLRGLAITGGAGITAPAWAQQSATVSDVAAAERLMNLNFTDAEREQILENMDDQLEDLETLATYLSDNGTPPAELFDPRLPGFTPPKQKSGAALPGNAPALPTDAQDIAFAPVWQQAQWIKARKLKSRDLTELYLKRIADIAPKLECFVTVTGDLARQQADQADKEIAAGKYRGPLHGLPYGLKDLFDTAGIRTSWGAMPYKDRVAERDSYVAQKLAQAGAVLIGKTTLGALANGEFWFGGVTRGPFNIEEGSSGSSAGSGAAVAAALASFTIGTETNGSLVSPANRSGCTILRPTFGRISREGAMALAWSLDKVGPMTRSVWDTAIILAALNGTSEGDPASIPMPFAYDAKAKPSNARIGYDPAWFEGNRANDLDREILAKVKAAGFNMIEVKLEELPYRTLLNITRIEAASAFEELTRSNQDDLLVRQDRGAWPNRFRTSWLIPAPAYIEIQRLRRKTMQAMAKMMNGVDVILHPNYADNLLIITNCTGHPTLALRGGFISEPTRKIRGAYLREGLNEAEMGPHRVPQAISLTGHLFDEGKLIAVAAMIEATLGVADERPPVE